MHPMLAALMLVVCCLIIWKACDFFEVAGDYFGQNLSGGLKGLLINATASSLPELTTTMIALMMFADVAGFGIGIGLTAGSAIYNAIVIPALCILAAIRKTGKNVLVERKTVLRDGISLLVCEALFIALVSGFTLGPAIGALLMAMYVVYAVFAYLTMDKGEKEPVDGSLAKSLLYLVGSLAAMGGACWLLVDSCEVLGHALGLPMMVTGLIFAAIATSVPDTYMSVRDSLRGEHEDAVANALGSNIFDICFALGFPLFVYTMFNGPITLSEEVVAQSFDLRISLLILTACAFVVFMSGKVVKTPAGVKPESVEKLKEALLAGGPERKLTWGPDIDTLDPEGELQVVRLGTQTHISLSMWHAYALIVLYLVFVGRVLCVYTPLLQWLGM